MHRRSNAAGNFATGCEASLSPDLSSVGRERYEYDGVACVVAGGPGGGQLPVFIRELELSG